MPHVIIKLKTGRTPEKKMLMARQVAQAVAAALECKEQVVSVSLEEIASDDWNEKVYRPDILEKPQDLYVKPGYNPFAK